MNTQALFETAVLGLAIGAIAMTTARTKIFKSTRYWVAGKSEWFGDLVRCPYCTIHWLSILAVIFYRPRILNRFYPIDLIVSVFVLVVFATVSAGFLIRRAWEGMKPVDQPVETAEEPAATEDEPTEATDGSEPVRDLIRHCWVHSGYPDCGYRQMTTEQKTLYCEIIGSDKAEHDAALDAGPRFIPPLGFEVTPPLTFAPPTTEINGRWVAKADVKQ